MQLSVGCVHKALKKTLNCSKKSAKWIPHLLTPLQKLCRVNLARHAIQMLGRRGEIQDLVATDESWFFCWDPEAKRSSCQWLSPNEPRPTKVRMERSTVNVMLVAFINCRGLIHREFIPDGRGITGPVFLQILKNFRESMRRKRLLVWRAQQWGLLMDNAPAHTSRIEKNWFNDRHIPLLPHAGYSPDLTPLDYWFFARVKKIVHGIRFHSAQELMDAVDNAIRLIGAQEFAQAFDRLVPRLHKCVAERGSYFEHE